MLAIAEMVLKDWVEEQSKAILTVEEESRVVRFQDILLRFDSYCRSADPKCDYSASVDRLTSLIAKVRLGGQARPEDEYFC